MSIQDTEEGNHIPLESIDSLDNQGHAIDLQI